MQNVQKGKMPDFTAIVTPISNYSFRERERRETYISRYSTVLQLNDDETCTMEFQLTVSSFVPLKKTFEFFLSFFPPVQHNSAHMSKSVDR